MRTNFDTQVLKRYMDGKEFADFEQRYSENLYVTKTIQKPSANDIAITNHVRKTLSYTQTAKELGISEYKVSSAVGRVGIYKTK